MNETEFVDLIQNCFEEEGYFSQRELGVGYGIADLVLINKEKINYKNCEIRRRNNQISPLFSENYFETLGLIPDENSNIKSVDFNYLQKKSHLSKSYLKYKILSYLKSTNYIRQLEDKSYLKINGWIPLVDEIVAIEAKLSDWRKGALQANRYKAFAHQVYLIIPEDKEHNVDKGFFLKHEIGLMVFNLNDRRKKIMINCPQKEPFDKNKSLFAQEFFLKTFQERLIVK